MVLGGNCFYKIKTIQLLGSEEIYKPGGLTLSKLPGGRGMSTGLTSSHFCPPLVQGWAQPGAGAGTVSQRGLRFSGPHLDMPPSVCGGAGATTLRPGQVPAVVTPDSPRCATCSGTGYSQTQTRLCP